MQIINANFNIDDSFEKFFSNYKDEVGELFKNGNQILSERDYEILYSKLASKAQWKIMPCLHPDRFEDTNRNFANNNERKYFFRCFGIYLREAVMRYGKDLAGEKGFWADLNKGIQRDLNKTYRERNSEDRRKKGFWEDDTPQNELTQVKYYVYGQSRLAYIYSFFDNQFIKNIEQRNNGFQYMRHLIKMAICPINYNPLRSKYAEIVEDVNHLETRINTIEKNSLDIHPKMRSTLTGRINNYFKYLPHIRDLYQHTDPEQRNHFIKDYAHKFFNIENQDHYYIDWLREDLLGEQRYFSQHRNSGTQNNNSLNKTDYKFVISLNTINQSISISAPSDIDLDELFGKELGLEPWEEYQITDSDGETLLTIQNSQVIKGADKSLYNSNVLKLISKEKINISGVGFESRTIKNPWYSTSNPYFIFNVKGKFQKNSVKLGESFFLVLPQDEKIKQVEENYVKRQDNPSEQDKDGLSLYEINVGNVDFITITTIKNNHFRRNIYLSVYDPKYLRHYESEETNQATIFMVQRRTHKIGIGTITFSLSENVTNPIELASHFNAQYGNNGVIARVDTEPNHAKRLIISNETQGIVEIPETEFGITKIIPKISLLPQGTVFWIAKRKGEADFSAFLKCATDIPNLDRQHWITKDSIFQYNTNGEEWRNSGSPVSFVQNGFTIFSRTPYWNDAINHEVPYATDFFWGNNPFDDLMPVGAKWLFQWEECNRKFFVTTSTNNSISKCVESLELEGNYPDMDFGWTFENTEFLLALSKKEGEYKLPSRAPKIYEKTEEERSAWLENLITRDIPTLRDDAHNLSQRFGITYNGEVPNSWNDETDVKHAIGKKFFNENIASGFRNDLTDYKDEQKIKWIEDWLSVSDWDGLLKLLLEELNTRNDSLYKTLLDRTDEDKKSFIKNFSSREDVYSFVNKRHILNPLTNTVESLLRLNNLEDYRTEIYDRLFESDPVQLVNNFDSIFNAIAIEIKKEQFKKIWQNICPAEHNKDLSDFIYFPEELKTACNVKLKQFAQRLLDWIEPIYKVLQSTKYLNFYIPQNFSRISDRINKEEDISTLANRYAIGIQECIKYFSDSEIQIELSQIPSFFNITESSFKFSNVQENHNFDFNDACKNRIKQYIQEQNKAQIIENLHEQVQQILANKPGYFEQITEEMYKDYINKKNKDIDIYAFLEFVNFQNDKIFQKENIIWKNNCLAYFSKANRPTIPGECLSMTAQEMRDYISKKYLNK